MRNIADNVPLHFGALAEPLKNQVPSWKIPVGMQENADAITRLNIHALLTPAEAHRARLRLIKALEKENQ